MALMDTRWMSAMVNQWVAFTNESSTPIPGLMEDLELPSLKAMTETLSGAGIQGEIEIPATGHFESGTIKLKFNVLDREFFALLDTTDVPKLTFAVCKQYIDRETSRITYKQIKVVCKGPALGAELGTLAKAKKSESEVELSYTYLKVEEDGDILLELDKLNGKWIINGADKFEEIKKTLML